MTDTRAETNVGAAVVGIGKMLMVIGQSKNCAVELTGLRIMLCEIAVMVVVAVISRNASDWARERENCWMLSLKERPGGATVGQVMSKLTV